MSTIKLKGSSSGEAGVTVAAAAGTPTFTLPTTVGSANQLLKNSGTAGTLEYSSNLTFDGNNLDVSGGCITTFGQNTTHEAASIKVGYEGSSKGQIRVYGADASTTGSLELNVCESDGTDPHTVTVKSSGDLDISDGNLVVASGHGIDFSATADGTGSNQDELLDDYEEGDWTPAPQFGSVTVHGAKYVKVGRNVSIWAEVSAPTTTGSGAQFKMTGLPFSSAGSQAGGSLMAKDMDSSTPTVYIGSGSDIYFYGINSGASWTTNAYDDFTSDTYIYFQATYMSS